MFIVLLSFPALPIPTGGVTNVLEVIAMLFALQLIAGRKTVWVPKRWCATKFEGDRSAKFIDGMITATTKMERFSKPRLTWLFGHWWSELAFGVTVLIGTIASAVAPPFSGLDTLPALGVVILSVGVIMEDFAFVVGGVLLIAVGIVLEITLGAALYRGVKSLF